MSWLTPEVVVAGGSLLVAVVLGTERLVQNGHMKKEDVYSALSKYRKEDDCKEHMQKTDTDIKSLGVKVDALTGVSADIRSDVSEIKGYLEGQST